MYDKWKEKSDYQIFDADKWMSEIVGKSLQFINRKERRVKYIKLFTLESMVFYSSLFLLHAWPIDMEYTGRLHKNFYPIQAIYKILDETL